MKRLSAFFGASILCSQMLMAQSVSLATSTVNPTKGTVVYNNITNQLQYWNGTSWIPVTNAASATGWAINGGAMYNSNSGGIGVGISTPQALFNIANAKTVVFGLDSTGIGNKLIWYGSKGAFRVGYIDNTTDYDLIGKKSFGQGNYIEASGESSSAFGVNTKAIGMGSFAAGNLTIAQGQYTMAAGSYNKATSYSTTAFGFHTIADRPYMTAVGTYNREVPDALFVVGNGTDEALRNNALIINAAGNIGVGTDLPTTKFEVVGTSSLNGSVGIGTSNPQKTLHVEGSSFLNGRVGIGFQTPQTNFDVLGSAYIEGPLGVGTPFAAGKFQVAGDTYLNGTTYHVGNTVITGKLVIGNDTPLAPIHISSSSSAAEINTKYFSYGTNNIQVLTNGTYNIGLYSIYDIVTNNSFVSAQSVTSSDARIKNIVGLSDNKADLIKLRQIKITDYRYKDVVNRGNQIYKKVIAQQVEQVYPEAVKQIKSTIPDIYTAAERVIYDSTTKELEVFLAKEYNLKVGEKLELVHPDKGVFRVLIADVSGNSFTIKDWPYATEKVFVFGREVNDFRTVDYEALSILGISAIQQLAKENDDLRRKNEALENKLKRIETDLMTRLEVLEQQLQKTSTGKLR